MPNGIILKIEWRSCVEGVADDGGKVVVAQQLALIIALQNVLLVIVGGAVLGRVSSAVLRQPWNLRVLVIDMCTAGAATILTLLAAALFDRLWQYAVHAATWVFIVAGVVAPVVRHGAAVALPRRHARE
jgi:hypothetical protein